MESNAVWILKIGPLRSRDITGVVNSPPPATNRGSQEPATNRVNVQLSLLASCHYFSSIRIEIVCLFCLIKFVKITYNVKLYIWTTTRLNHSRLFEIIWGYWSQMICFSFDTDLLLSWNVSTYFGIDLLNTVNFMIPLRSSFQLTRYSCLNWPLRS